MLLAYIKLRIEYIIQRNINLFFNIFAKAIANKLFALRHTIINNSSFEICAHFNNNVGIRENRKFIVHYGSINGISTKEQLLELKCLKNLYR